MEKIDPIATVGRLKELSVVEVSRYFKTSAGKLKPTYPPMNPKAGEVYMYLIQDDSSKGR